MPDTIPHARPEAMPPSDAMPDTAPPTNLDRTAYIRALVAHRVPEASEADLRLLADGQPDPDAIPANIADKILDVISALSDRFDEFERRFA
jgi:hypothetical protein